MPTTLHNSLKTHNAYCSTEVIITKKGGIEDFTKNQPKGQPTMKTKLDTMNHIQRAEFARSLYRRPIMRRNSVTAVTGYGIRTREAK